MQIKNLITGEIFTAHYSTEHAASSYGQPVIVIDETGEAVDQFGYEILPEAAKSVWEITGKLPENTKPETWHTITEWVSAMTEDDARSVFRKNNPQHTRLSSPVLIAK